MVVLLLAAMGACSDRSNQAAASKPEEPATNASRVATDREHPQPTKLPPSIARQLVGTWKAAGEICDPEANRKPSKHVAAASLTLTADGRYRRVEAGDDVRGSFTLSASQERLTITLDEAAMLSRYNFVNGRLENWGEGEAVYPCATIFERPI